ncbi:MAG: hypothetical protein KGD59_12560 [Candidatus Heimdallarchaeota archaeon]|nr:hypothetical protein [Candidatus Heimdallarchaeota archaeon]MBY8995376.1 hypothetical protein [Candidatus Heimdallarchaeota archaeon]
MSTTKKDKEEPDKQTSSKEKTSSKAKTISAKEEKTLNELKKSVESLVVILNKTALSLPSLVSTRGVDVKDISSILEDKFEIDLDLISMLEDFFKRLMLLLRYRSSYDQKLFQMTRYIKNLRKADTITEFRGNLQLLGITLNETETIVKNYEEMYNSLFIEQALLQFQLMEQLLMFREKDVPEFREYFNQGIETFQKITKKISKLKE